jgi:hypothetical protein
MFGSKRSFPAPVIVTPAQDSDAVYRAAWGFTPSAWAALNNQERVWYRDHVLSASTVNAR